MKQVIITTENFDVAQEYAALCAQAPQSGAVVFFVGLVRDLYDDQCTGEKIEYLELEHYPGMTEELCRDILDQADRRYPFDAAKVIHRVGKIYASEQIVLVCVASRHRDNAFQASQFIMDYLKTRATLWKKEVGVRGEQWVGMKEKDSHAVKRWVTPSDKTN